MPERAAGVVWLVGIMPYPVPPFESDPLVATTLGHLRSYGVPPPTLSPETTLRDVLTALDGPSVIGVVITPDSAASPEARLISRDGVARELARPYVRDLYQRRPIRDFLKNYVIATTRFGPAVTIESAAALLSTRPSREQFEPTLVADDSNQSDPFLLSADAVLLAQTDLLRATQASLAEEQRRAGRAETAACVLHDVGNALNSVTTAAHAATTVIRELDAGQQLDRCARLLEEATADGTLPSLFKEDGRGQQLAPFLRALSDEVRHRDAAVSAELRDLNRGVEHVREAIRRQQQDAEVYAPLQESDPAAICDEAVAAFLATLRNEPDQRPVRVSSVYDHEIGRVRCDPHRVMRILTNFLQNAGRATSDIDGDRHLSIRVGQRRPTAAAPPGITREIVLSVTDNGRGIEASKLDAIFRPGFTTKAERSGHGLGLHSTAIAAQEMHGIVEVDSDGPGRGATFRLVLRDPSTPAETMMPALRVAA
jgi:signal transduction histidine kinase